MDVYGITQWPDPIRDIQVDPSGKMREIFQVRLSWNGDVQVLDLSIAAPGTHSLK